MKILHKLIFIYICLYANAAIASDLNLWGYIENYTGYSFAKEKESNYEFVIAENKLNLKGEKKNEDSKLYIQADLIGNLIKNNKVNDVTTELLECYIDFYFEYMDIRLGKHILSWGVADGFFITNFSPLDLRKHLSGDLDSLKLGQTGISCNISTELIRIEAVTFFIPQQHMLPEMNTAWEIPVNSSIPIIVIDAKNKNQYPDYGLRISKLIGPLDISFIYSSIYNKIPYFEKEIILDSSGQSVLQLSECYERRHTIGTYFTLPIDKLLVKAEASYTFDELLETKFETDIDKPGIIRRDILKSLLGVEFTLIQDLRINFQYYNNYIVNHEIPLLQDEYKNQISANSKFIFLNSMSFEIFGIADLNYKDFMMRFEYGWKYSDKIKIEAGIHMYEGEEDTEFGKYDKIDFTYLRVKYLF